MIEGGPHRHSPVGAFCFDRHRLPDRPWLSLLPCDNPHGSVREAGVRIPNRTVYVTVGRDFLFDF